MGFLGIHLPTTLMTMKTLANWALTIFLMGGALVTPAGAANDARMPRLLVPGDKAEAKKEPLRMSGLEIEVEVLGHLATTTMTMTFRNDTDRVLEGELEFPLGDGESVSRFAMSMGDIDTMREGAVVEKARGRQIFESTVRKQVDPGLLEMTKGNNFRSRVYPIPAKGEKRIVVGYEGVLRDVGDRFAYSLPLVFQERVDVFGATVKVLGVEGVPDFSGGLLEGEEAATVSKQDFLPARPLAFTIPKGDAKSARDFRLPRQEEALLPHHGGGRTGGAREARAGELGVALGRVGLGGGEGFGQGAGGVGCVFQSLRGTRGVADSDPATGWRDRSGSWWRAAIGRSCARPWRRLFRMGARVWGRWTCAPMVWIRSCW